MAKVGCPTHGRSRYASQRPKVDPEEGSWAWSVLPRSHPTSEGCLEGWGDSSRESGKGGAGNGALEAKT